MGLNQSRIEINEERLNVILSGLTLFNTSEIKKLYVRFHHLCQYYIQGSDSPHFERLPFKAIFTIPEFKYLPLPIKHRIAQVFGECYPDMFFDKLAFKKEIAERTREYEKEELQKYKALNNPTLVVHHIDPTSETTSVPEIVEKTSVEPAANSRTRARLALLNMNSHVDHLYCSFESFVDMLSVFSVRAPFLLKARTAFQLYDFDEDNYISRLDVDAMVATLNTVTTQFKTKQKKHKKSTDVSTSSPFHDPNEFIEEQIGTLVSEQDVADISDLVVAQMDVDDNVLLSEIEFTRLLRKTPDFMEKFSIATRFEIDKF